MWCARVAWHVPPLAGAAERLMQVHASRVQELYKGTSAKATKLAMGMRGVLILLRIVDTAALPMTGGKDDIQVGQPVHLRPLPASIDFVCAQQPGPVLRISMSQ